MHYYLTRRSLDSAIEIIESADTLLGGNVRVTESHKVFRSILAPALICAIVCIDAAVCLAVYIHPVVGIIFAAVSAYIAVRIRNKRLHLQRIIVYDRAVERRVLIADAVDDKLKGKIKEKYEKALGDTDPEARKAELIKVNDELGEIVKMLAHDIVI